MNTELSFAELGLLRLLIRDIRIAMVLNIPVASKIRTSPSCRSGWSVQNT